MIFVHSMKSELYFVRTVFFLLQNITKSYKSKLSTYSTQNEREVIISKTNNIYTLNVH